MKNLILLFILIIPTSIFSQYMCQQAITPPLTEGLPIDDCWKLGEWKPIDILWIGYYKTMGDFSGEYKILWDTSKLYFLVKTVDDVVVDSHSDPLSHYSDDDCIEIFIDEDHSGGWHQTSHNAFAYHISLKLDVVDIGTDGAPHLYNDIISGSRLFLTDTNYWEFSMSIYDDTYIDESNSNVPVTLHAGKTIGFSVAYNDADGLGVRETMTGSHDINDPNYNYDKNINWITADNFDSLLLVPAIVNNITNLYKVKEENDYQIFPSPADLLLKIRTDSYNKASTIIIFNEMGQMILEKNLNSNKLNISTQSFKEGLYLVIIKEDMTIMYKQKIMIIH